MSYFLVKLTTPYTIFMQSGDRPSIKILEKSSLSISEALMFYKIKQQMPKSSWIVVTYYGKTCNVAFLQYINANLLNLQNTAIKRKLVFERRKYNSFCAEKEWHRDWR